MLARRSIGRQITLAALGCAGCNALLGLDDGIPIQDRCQPLEITACYSGPDGTRGVGACVAGRRQCNAEGDGYGPCEGEVTPAPEVCGNEIDDDCDGEVDEPDDGATPGAAERAAEDGDRCTCAPGSTDVCPYGGPPGTEGAGACRAGVRVCGSDGRWGPCEGEVVPRSEDCATKDDEACDGDEDCGAVLWTALLGGPGLQEGRALALDGRGAILVGGEFEGTLELGAMRIASGAERDVFVARLDGSGKPTWARRLVDEGKGRLTALAAAPDGAVAVAGELEGVMRNVSIDSSELPGFVVKLGPEGNVLWGASLPGPPSGVAMSTEGDVVVASAAIDATGKSDVDVAMFSAAQGVRLWRKVLGGAGEQAPGGVAMDARGRVVLVGSFEGTIEIGEGGPQLASSGKSDVFLAKLDRHGQVLDVLRYGDARDQRGGDVAIEPSGEIALSGTFEGFLDLGGGALFEDRVSAFVAGFGPSGEHRFSRSIQTSTPPRIALEAGGGVVIAGDVKGPLNLGGGPLGGAGRGHDVYVARLDPLGRHVWSRRLGPGSGRPTGAGRWAADVAIDAARGQVLLLGTVEGSVDVGGGVETSNERDLLLLRHAF